MPSELRDRSASSPRTGRGSSSGAGWSSLTDRRVAQVHSNCVPGPTWPRTRRTGCPPQGCAWDKRTAGSLPSASSVGFVKQLTGLAPPAWKTPSVPPIHASTMKDVCPPGAIAVASMSVQSARMSQSATCIVAFVSLRTSSDPTSPGGGSKAQGPPTTATAKQPPTTNVEATTRAMLSRRRRSPRDVRSSLDEGSWPAARPGPVATAPEVALPVGPRGRRRAAPSQTPGSRSISSVMTPRPTASVGKLRATVRLRPCHGRADRPDRRTRDSPVRGDAPLTDPYPGR